jgi:nitrous oxide reductase accessory protein NosL
MRAAAGLAAAALLAAVCHAADWKPAKPGPGDKCPVCGMFVAKYPDFAAEVIYPDGRRAYFDGAKDLFKYLLSPKAYDPSRRRSEITAIHVTDYYSLAPVDGKRALYVIGSDVLGPMGKELIPFAVEKEAREFLADHKGKRILRFDEVTAELLKGLD